MRITARGLCSCSFITNTESSWLPRGGASDIIPRHDQSRCLPMGKVLWTVNARGGQPTSAGGQGRSETKFMPKTLLGIRSASQNISRGAPMHGPRRQGRSGLSKARLTKQGDVQTGRVPRFHTRCLSWATGSVIWLRDGTMLHAYSDTRYKRRAQSSSHATLATETHHGLWRETKLIRGHQDNSTLICTNISSSASPEQQICDGGITEHVKPSPQPPASRALAIPIRQSSHLASLFRGNPCLQWTAAPSVGGKDGGGCVWDIRVSRAWSGEVPGLSGINCLG